MLIILNAWLKRRVDLIFALLGKTRKRNLNASINQIFNEKMANLMHASLFMVLWAKNILIF